MNKKIDKYCPNMLYSGNNVTIGEFKTLEECMNYPLKDVWPLKSMFEKHKIEGDRFFIINSMNRYIFDPYRWVILVVHRDKTKEYYDAYDMPIVEFFWNEYENSLGKKGRNAIKRLTN